MRSLLLFSLLFFYISTSAQVTGLWEVTLVQAGDQTPTPVAKWFELKENGDLLSGNGGIINMRGGWQLEENQLLFSNPAGESDPTGPFLVTNKGEQMTLSREEEGMQVIVTLQKAKAIPMASWDYLYGGWRLTEVWNGEEDRSTDFTSSSMYIRWDHQFTIRNSWSGEGTQAGIWQIHGHRSEIRMVYFNEGLENELWTIESINQNQLVLIKKEGPDSVSRLVFKR